MHKTPSNISTVPLPMPAEVRVHTRDSVTKQYILQIYCQKPVTLYSGVSNSGLGPLVWV